MPNHKPKDFPPKLLWGFLALPVLLLVLAIFFPPSEKERTQRAQPCFQSWESNRLRFMNLRSVHYATEQLDRGYQVMRHKAFLNPPSPYFRPVLVYSPKHSEAYIRFESESPGTVLILGSDTCRADTGDAEHHWRMAYALARRFREREKRIEVWSAERRELRELTEAERKAFLRSLDDYFQWIPPDGCRETATPPQHRP